MKGKLIMFRKLKDLFIVTIGVVMIGAPALIPAYASAQGIAVTNATNNLCSGANLDFNDTTDCSDLQNAGAGGTLNSIVTTIINIFSIIVGAVAIIMIIIGGFRYVVSGGNDSSVSGAKNTIIFALVGLIIVALAQTIVRFVLDRVANG